MGWRLCRYTQAGLRVGRRLRRSGQPARVAQAPCAYRTKFEPPVDGWAVTAGVAIALAAVRLTSRFTAIPGHLRGLPMRTVVPLRAGLHLSGCAVKLRRSGQNPSAACGFPKVAAAIAAHHLEGGKLAHHFLGNRFGGPLSNHQHPMRLPVDEGRTRGRRLSLAQIDIIDGSHPHIVPCEVLRDDRGAPSLQQARDRFPADANV